jgi:hypothetical protein
LNSVERIYQRRSNTYNICSIFLLSLTIHFHPLSPLINVQFFIHYNLSHTLCPQTFISYLIQSFIFVLIYYLIYFTSSIPYYLSAIHSSSYSLFFLWSHIFYVLIPTLRFLISIPNILYILTVLLTPKL